MNIDRINYHNKDTRIKLSIQNHADFLLKILHIRDKVVRVLEKDMTTTEGKNFKLDFKAELKSGRILDVEGESKIIKDEQLKKSLGYRDEIYCKEKKQTITIMISLSKGNNQRTYKSDYCIIFEPYLLEIKNFDGEEYLNKYKNKVENNEVFTQDDCAEFEMIPEMYFERNMEDVIIELAHLLNKANVTKTYKNLLVTIMNLSIDYYIEDKDKRKELTGMLKMEEAYKSQYDKLIDYAIESEDRGIKKGIKEGELKILNSLIGVNGFTAKNLAEKYGYTESQIINGK